MKNLQDVRGITIGQRNINNIIYAEDTLFIAEN